MQTQSETYVVHFIGKPARLKFKGEKFFGKIYFHFNTIILDFELQGKTQLVHMFLKITMTYFKELPHEDVV